MNFSIIKTTGDDFMIKLRKTAFALTMSFVMLFTTSFMHLTLEQYVCLDDAIYIDFDLPSFGEIPEFIKNDSGLLAEYMEIRRLMEIQAPAVAVYNVLMQAFFNGIELVYTDTYAGAFIDYDTLVIQLTDISADVTAFYVALLGYDAPIRFKQVEFSLNQLIAIVPF